MKEHVIPFPSHARSTGEADPLQSPRRRRETRDTERPAQQRRPRRRRQSAPWLQRNALSVVALSILIGVLGLGFGLLQMLTRAEQAPGATALAQSDSPATANSPLLLNAASLGPSVQVNAPVPIALLTADGARQIQSAAKVLDPNYTIAAGDTLNQIALRFNTSAARVQAFNDLADPRALRIGTKLVIPPPL